MMVNRRSIRFLSASICWVFVVLLFFVNHSLTTFAAEEEQLPLSYSYVVEVENYEIEDGYIRAGKENIIKLKIRNANKNAAVTGLVSWSYPLMKQESWHL